MALLRSFPMIPLMVSLNLLAVGPGDGTIRLNRLNDPVPSDRCGISWGVPWPMGFVKNDQPFSISDEDGRMKPLQWWPMAYWPDGSVKWTGFATVVDSQTNGQLSIRPVNKSPDFTEGNPVSVKESKDSYLINTGKISCVIPKKGQLCVDSLMSGEKLTAKKGQLVCILQNGPDNETDPQPVREQYTGLIEKVTLEQQGPVRAVVKIEGMHHCESNNKKWLPFILRLYFYAGTGQIRIIHTIIYDGDDQRDFIRGLGMKFSVPFREEIQNRHVRFTSFTGGIYDEPVQPLTGRERIRFGDGDIYADQVKGKRVPDYREYNKEGQFLIDNWASWNDYKLFQPNPYGFTIRKRTNRQSSWIDADAGHQSSGLAFIGDVSGGLAIGVKDFRESFPSALEIRNARGAEADLFIWFWPPEAPVMDLRHYDTVAHNLNASYEDVQPGFSTPSGIARTSEILLFPTANVPSNEMLIHYAELTNHSPHLVCTPEYLHSVRAFGYWSLPDRTSYVKNWIENQLDSAFAFYRLEVEQRNWYGFWNYGDIMHAYDPIRHTWRYDVGGYAWDNTELMPDMWLWYSFLRTGRADIFRMAEAMTRHTSEVDVYHLGRFAGLGSRHNVQHWGCGAKEVRISQAALKRFYYYLTTDERTGDLMHEVTENANRTIGKIDPLRLIEPPSRYPTHARIGPDWLALVGNWMTEWERTGDIQWRNNIITGVNCFAEMPYGLYSGREGAFGYDPQTCRIYQLDKDRIGYSHLSVLMGGPEVAFELSDFLNDTTWNRLWMQYCELFGALPEETEKVFGVKTRLGRISPHYARLPAYVAFKTGDTELAEKAWNQFLYTRRGSAYSLFKPIPVDPAKTLNPVSEVRWISTNNTAQWCLNAIELLEFIGDHAPESFVDK
jgi:hypothetical protein